MRAKHCVFFALLSLTLAPLSPTQAQTAAPQTITKPTLTVLHSFSGTDGSNPSAPPVVGADGALYGVTSTGGKSGAAYRIMPDGMFTLLHKFNASTDGSYPVGLALGPDGNLYGACRSGGSRDDAGTVFRLTPAGALTLLHVFTYNGEGAIPDGTVTVGSDGTLYGITTAGAGGYGTVFKLRLPH